MTTSSNLSTADQRRPLVVRSAVTVFARGGYYGTTVADVARNAKISPAYVFKLFPSKEHLFIAAINRCFDEVLQALEDGAQDAVDATPVGLLYGMGDAYAGLVADRTLLMLQVHAQSVSGVHEINDALQGGIARVTAFAKERSGAADQDVQRFMAYGQLCHLIVTAHIDGLAHGWARILLEGIRHPAIAASTV